MNNRKKTELLIIDDEEIWKSRFTDLLKDKTDFRVMPVEPIEALQKVEFSYSPCLLIIDLLFEASSIDQFDAHAKLLSLIPELIRRRANFGQIAQLNGACRTAAGEIRR